jgi:hypothetical protein
VYVPGVAGAVNKAEKALFELCAVEDATILVTPKLLLPTGSRVTVLSHVAVPKFSIVTVPVKVAFGATLVGTPVVLTHWSSYGPMTTLTLNGGVMSPKAVPLLSICHCIE